MQQNDSLADGYLPASETNPGQLTATLLPDSSKATVDRALPCAAAACRSASVSAAEIGRKRATTAMFSEGIYSTVVVPWRLSSPAPDDGSARWRLLVLLLVQTGLQFGTTPPPTGHSGTYAGNLVCHTVTILTEATHEATRRACHRHPWPGTQQ